MKNSSVVSTALLAGLALSLAVISNAWALAAPSAGTLAYDVYDIGVNGILKGPIGFIGGLSAVVYGAYLAVRSEIMGSVPALLGGAALLKADAIVTTLGAII